MRTKRMRTALIYAFALVIGATLIGFAFSDTLVGYVGFLLSPGIWIVYLNLDVNNHDLLPFVSAQLINIFVYWMAFALLLGLFRKGRREKMETAGRG
jgi:hypothetical protein